MLSSATEANTIFSKCAGRLILIRRPVFKIASLKDILEGGSAGLLAIGTLPNHGKKLCSASNAVDCFSNVRPASVAAVPWI